MGHETFGAWPQSQQEQSAEETEIIAVEQQPENKETPETFEAEAVKSEEGALNKFLRGKAGKLARTLTLVTALTIGGGMVAGAKEAFAGEKEDTTLIEQLNKIPDNPNAVNPAQNGILKERAIRATVQRHALGEEKQGVVTPGAMKSTAERLLKIIDKNTADPSVLKVLEQMSR